GTAIMGVLAGKSPKTGCGKNNKALEFLAQLAPHVFLFGLLVFVSWLIGALMPWSGTQNGYWPRLNAGTWTELLLWFGGCAAISFYAGWRVDVNKFSLHGTYANRLIRCYLAASQPKKFRKLPPLLGVKLPPVRQANPITGFDP